MKEEIAAKRLCPEEPAWRPRRRSLGHLWTLIFMMLATMLFTTGVYAYGPSDITVPSGAASIVYGTSGAGRNLTAYRFGSGKNVMVLGFSIHGYEDNFTQDGGALVWAAGQLMQQLSQNQSLIDSYDWTVYVLPCMNPDGLLDGYSHNGPGRHTTTYLTANGSLSGASGIDLNRSFPYRWSAYSSGRYFNGSQPLAAKESQALAQFIQQVKGSGRNVLIDTHGWTQQIITLNKSMALYKTFSEAFPSNTYSNITTGRGYFASYAYSLGYEACLFEFPSNVYSLSGFQSSGYSEKYSKCVLSLLRSYGSATSYYTVAAGTKGSGSVTGGGRYAKGKTASLTAKPVGDWGFLGWYDESGQQVSTSLTYSFAVSGDATLTAQFGPRIQAAASYSGSAAGSGVYPQGSTVTVTAGTGEHAFLGWYRTDGTFVSGDAAYSFTCQGPVTLAAMYEGDIFYDIGKNSWYRSYALESYSRGLVKGTTSVAFSGDDGMTRGQVVTVLARMDGSEQSDAEACPFGDVDQSKYYAKAINWAYANGIVSGVDSLRFEPNSSVTREQMLTMLVRYAEYRGITPERAALSFADAQTISPYARTYIEKAMTMEAQFEGSRVSLASGYPDGTMQPKRQLSRAEGVTFMVRLALCLEEQTPAEAPKPDEDPALDEDPTPDDDPAPEEEPKPEEDNGAGKDDVEALVYQKLLSAENAQDYDQKVLMAFASWVDGSLWTEWGGDDWTWSLQSTLDGSLISLRVSSPVLEDGTISQHHILCDPETGTVSWGPSGWIWA